MEEFRKKIDDCDKKIIEALIERLEIAKEIGKFKKANNLPIVDKKREEKVLEKVKNLGQGKISSDVIEKIYRIIIDTAVDLQEKN